MTDRMFIRGGVASLPFAIVRRCHVVTERAGRLIASRRSFFEILSTGKENRPFNDSPAFLPKEIAKKTGNIIPVHVTRPRDYRCLCR